MASVLGIDAGGSGSRAWQCDTDERWIADQQSDAIQVAALGVAAAADRLAELVHKSHPRPEAIVAGLAGAGDADTRAALVAQLRARGVTGQLSIVGDVEVAAACALARGSGIAAWAGTGSFAVARAPNGTLQRAGGRGWLLGDEGGGFDLVRRAARAAVRGHDGLELRAADLASSLCAAFSAASVARLGARLQQLAPAEIAAQAPLVLRLAQAGDPAAQRAAQAAFAELAVLVQHLAERALGTFDGPVVLGGGLFSSSAFARELFGRYFPAGVTLAECTAAQGAARLAIALLHDRTPLCRWVTDGLA